MLGRHPRRSLCRGARLRMGSATTVAWMPTADGWARSGRCLCERTADGRKPPGRPERSNQLEHSPAARPPALPPRSSRAVRPEPQAFAAGATAAGLTTDEWHEDEICWVEASGAEVPDPQVLTLTRVGAIGAAGSLDGRRDGGTPGRLATPPRRSRVRSSPRNQPQRRAVPHPWGAAAA
jgi:hypothetical protein